MRRFPSWLGPGPALLLALVGCAPSAAPPQELTLAVSIVPQASLLETIGGGRLTVVTAVAPGESPHTFDPSPRHMADLAAARAYFSCGVPMENYLVPKLRSSYPRIEIVDTVEGVARLPLAAHDHRDDEQAGGAAEAENELDPHLWLDPMVMAKMAVVMAGTLARLDPEHASRYRARGDSLTVALTALDAELRATLAEVRGREFFVFHPAFGYFAQAYGLRQVAIEQGGIDPSARHLGEILGRIKTQGARAVFVQPQFSLGSARAIARDTGVELVVLDPLAPDYADNLRRMALAIREGLIKGGLSKEVPADVR